MPLRLPRTSLRARTLAVVAVVAVAPALIVLFAPIGERGIGARLTHRLAAAATATAEAVASQTTTEGRQLALAAVAAREGLRLRLIDASGAVVAEADHSASDTVMNRLLAALLGEGEPSPTLDLVDAELGALANRPEIAQARARGRHEDCRYARSEDLLVCHAALSLSLGGEDHVVYAQQGSRRAIRALTEARLPVIKLTLVVLGLGLVLAYAVSLTVVRPIARLRADLLRRAAAAVPRADLSAHRADELGGLTDAFNTLLKALAERARANEAGLADLVHELKSPVAAVRACAEALESGEAPADARTRRLAGVLREAGGRLDHLVHDFLELARAEAGLPSAPRQRLDLGALARGLAKTQNARGGARVVATAPPAALEVSCVLQELEAAVRNVIENAASFAGDGGLVEVEVARRGDVVELRVSDDGPGIAPEHLPRVFDRFFTTRGERRGTGLGLALARAVVEAHGGTIRAESRAEGGALFVIALPRAAG